MDDMSPPVLVSSVSEFEAVIQLVNPLSQSDNRLSDSYFVVDTEQQSEDEVATSSTLQGEVVGTSRSHVNNVQVYQNTIPSSLQANPSYEVENDLHMSDFVLPTTGNEEANIGSVDGNLGIADSDIDDSEDSILQTNAHIVIPRFQDNEMSTNDVTETQTVHLHDVDGVMIPLFQISNAITEIDSGNKFPTDCSLTIPASQCDIEMGNHESSHQNEFSEKQCSEAISVNNEEMPDQNTGNGFSYIVLSSNEQNFVKLLDSHKTTGYQEAVKKSIDILFRKQKSNNTVTNAAVILETAIPENVDTNSKMEETENDSSNKDDKNRKPHGYHSENKVHICDVCGKKFSRRFNLQQHMVVHNEKCPYHCILCSRSYKGKYMLDRHMKSHKKSISGTAKNQIKEDEAKIDQSTVLLSSNAEKKNIQLTSNIEQNEVKLSSSIIEHSGNQCFRGNDICDVQVTCNSGLEDHVYTKSNHIYINPDHIYTHLTHSYRCLPCNKVFKCPKDIQMHLSSHVRIMPKKVCSKISDQDPGDGLKQVCVIDNVNKNNESQRRQSNKSKNRSDVITVYEISNSSGSIEFKEKDKVNFESESHDNVKLKDSCGQLERKDQQKNNKTVIGKNKPDIGNSQLTLNHHPTIIKYSEGISPGNCVSQVSVQIDKKLSSYHSECEQEMVNNMFSENTPGELAEHEVCLKSPDCERLAVRASDSSSDSVFKNVPSPILKSTSKQDKRKGYHSEKETHTCTICGKVFNRKYNLLQHYTVHDVSKPYQCKECGCSFKRLYLLKCHVRKWHSQDKPFRCDTCGQSFILKNYLEKHALIHTGNTMYECDICDKSFTLKNNLIKHIKCHTQGLGHPCDLCSKEFATDTQLTKHINNHMTVTAKPFSCYMCHKWFQKHRYLTAHIKRNHHRDENSTSDT